MSAKNEELLAAAIIGGLCVVAAGVIAWECAKEEKLLALPKPEPSIEPPTTRVIVYGDLYA